MARAKPRPKVTPDSTLEEFEARLAEAIDSELHRWVHRFRNFEELRVFDVGCFPWHAYIELSFLTNREDEITTQHPSGIAGWRWYSFAEGWDRKFPTGGDLIEWLKPYRETEMPRYAYGEIWNACARAVMSKRVQKRLESFTRTDDFICTVFDPDSMEPYNYCTGELVEWLRR